MYEERNFCSKRINTSDFNRRKTTAKNNCDSLNIAKYCNHFWAPYFWHFGPSWCCMLQVYFHVTWACNDYIVEISTRLFCHAHLQVKFLHRDTMRRDRGSKFLGCMCGCWAVAGQGQELGLHTTFWAWHFPLHLQDWNKDVHFLGKFVLEKKYNHLKSLSGNPLIIITGKMKVFVVYCCPYQYFYHS